MHISLSCLVFTHPSEIVMKLQVRCAACGLRHCADYARQLRWVSAEQAREHVTKRRCMMQIVEDYDSGQIVARNRGLLGNVAEILLKIFGSFVIDAVRKNRKKNPIHQYHSNISRHSKSLSYLNVAIDSTGFDRCDFATRNSANFLAR